MVVGHRALGASCAAAPPRAKTPKSSSPGTEIAAAGAPQGARPLTGRRRALAERVDPSIAPKRRSAPSLEGEKERQRVRAPAGAAKCEALAETSPGCLTSESGMGAPTRAQALLRHLRCAQSAPRRATAMDVPQLPGRILRGWLLRSSHLRMTGQGRACRALSGMPGLVPAMTAERRYEQRPQSKRPGRAGPSHSTRVGRT